MVLRHCLIGTTLTECAKLASRDFQKQLAGYGLIYRQHSLSSSGSSLVAAEPIYGKRTICARPSRRFSASSISGADALDGDLHSVMVAHSNLIKPAELRAIDGVFRLH